MSNEDDNPWESYAKSVKRLTPSEEEKRVETKKDKKENLVMQAKQKEKEEKTNFEIILDASSAPQFIKTKSKETAKLQMTAHKRVPEILDVRVERNLSLGDVMIEAKIDLHGKTEDEAHDAFQDFLEKQSNLNRRVLLVITGKSGILRKNLPRWCEVAPLCDKVLAVRTAALHHGGDGAYYLLLRKK